MRPGRSCPRSRRSATATRSTTRSSWTRRRRRSPTRASPRRSGRRALGSFYVGDNIDIPHLLEQAIRAHTVYQRDRDYVVAPDEDGQQAWSSSTRTPAARWSGRQWSDGLHQAVEAKESVPIKQETQTMATITIQNFFKLYEQAGRHDRHRGHRGDGVLRDLQARRRGDPHQRAGHPQRPQRPGLHVREGQVGRDRRRDQEPSTTLVGPILVGHDERREVRAC